MDDVSYYAMATVLPIDKIIGRIYPLFVSVLFLMAVSLIIGLIVNGYHIPELNIDTFRNLHSEREKYPIFPMLFISVACGAISGFHATQSPLMARCITNENLGHRVFYGAMIAEAFVAMIWATISMSIFGGERQLNDIMIEHQGNAAWVGNNISNSLLGRFGGGIALLGIVAASITSGDTALRSARLVIADILRLKQRPVFNRLAISIPIFLVGFLYTQINFSIIGSYFAWSNQTLATIVLWTITVFLVNNKKNYWITLVPSFFMTTVISTYILLAPEGFNLKSLISCPLGLVITSGILIFFIKER